MIDDSELFHGTYDPAKAHAYYMKMRQLKGRQAGVQKAPSGRPSGTRTSGHTGGKPNRADTKSYHAKLEAEKAALEKRLTHLRDVLKELVDAAKKRSGGDPNHKKDHHQQQSATTPAAQKSKADRNAAQKKDKPLTATQKHHKAQAAKKAYEKAHPNSLSQDIDVLQAQVKDIHTKIQKALDDARERRKTAGIDATKRPAHHKQPSGPQGR